MGDGHGGTIEYSNIEVSTARGGRLVRAETFGVDALDVALARLIERWADDELDPDGQARAENMLRAFRLNAHVHARDWPAFGAIFAEEAQLIDHRPSAAGSVEGRAAITAWLSTFMDGYEWIEAQYSDVHALSPRGAVLQERSRGRVGAADWEMAPLAALRFGPDGLVSHFEVFEEEQLRDALALFDEWDGS